MKNFQKLLTCAAMSLFLQAAAGFPAVAQTKQVSLKNMHGEEATRAEDERVKEARAFIEGLGDKVVNILKSKEEMSEEALRSRFRSLLEENFALKTIGRFALGRYWRVATPEQREEYIRLYEDMIVNLYFKRFKNYSGETLVTDGASIASKSDVVVDTTIRSPGGENLKVNWRVRQKNGKKRIVDVIVEGVSMLVTQRSDFASVIQRGGGRVEALLKDMRQSG